VIDHQRIHTKAEGTSNCTMIRFG